MAIEKLRNPITGAIETFNTADYDAQFSMSQKLSEGWVQDVSYTTFSNAQQPLSTEQNSTDTQIGDSWSNVSDMSSPISEDLGQTKGDFSSIDPILPLNNRIGLIGLSDVTSSNGLPSPSAQGNVSFQNNLNFTSGSDNIYEMNSQGNQVFFNNDLLNDDEDTY